MTRITSRDNSLLRHARAVRDGKIADSIFAEGLRLAEEALQSGLEIEAVIYSEKFAQKERGEKLIRDLEQDSVKSASVSEKLLQSISYTKTPQGIVVLATRPALAHGAFAERLPETPLLLILHRINNPVNVGAILRTAEAAGATGVIATAGTADPFSPKSLRGAMGSAFRLAIWTGIDYGEAIDWCRRMRLQTVCADVHSPQTYTEIEWRQPTAIIMGSESEGLSPEEIALTDRAVKIPMQGRTESLNVAVAAGILLYEAARQK
jgi:RNA methyltransferase, TrmH family